MAQSADCINKDICLPYLSKGMCVRCAYYVRVYEPVETGFDPELLRRQIVNLKKELAIQGNRIDALIRSNKAKQADYI